MEKIMPIFRDENDKLLTIIALIASIFLPVIPFLVLFFLKDNLSENSFAITKAFLNFEILLFVISLICWVPIVGWIICLIFGPIILLINAVIMLMGILSILNNKEVCIPKIVTLIN